MKQYHDFILEKVVKTCKIHYEIEYDLYVMFFPEINGACIQSGCKNYWYDCSGISDAIEQHLTGWYAEDASFKF